MVGVNVTSAARADLEEITDYLAERNPIAAIRFVEAAEGAFGDIALMPNAYRRLDTAAAELRELRYRPLGGAFHRYLVFYRVQDEEVEVVRVLHSARDTARILGRG